MHHRNGVAHNGTAMSEVTIGDVSMTRTGHTAIVEMHRPPHNYFDVGLLQNLVEAFAICDADAHVSASVAFFLRAYAPRPTA